MSQGLTLLHLAPHPHILHQMDLKESQVQRVEHRLYFRVVVEKTEFNQVKYSQGREWAMIKGAAGQIYIRK